jgi:hypothetical protein
MRRVLRENALSLVLFGMFFTTFLFGQSLAGHREYNSEQRDHGGQAISYTRYLTTAHFGEATFENWESEFLQMGFYVLLTAYLVQKGSSESKKLDEPEDVDEDPREAKVTSSTPWPVRAGGAVLWVYERSLTIAMFALFFASFFLHAATGAREYNADQAEHGGPGVSVLGYMTTSRFWFESMQNWQSEFLAVGAIVVLSIFCASVGHPSPSRSRRRTPRQVPDPGSRVGPKRDEPPTVHVDLTDRRRPPSWGFLPCPARSHLDASAAACSPSALCCCRWRSHRRARSPARRRRRHCCPG